MFESKRTIISEHDSFVAADISRRLMPTMNEEEIRIKSRAVDGTYSVTRSRKPALSERGYLQSCFPLGQTVFQRAAVIWNHMPPAHKPDADPGASGAGKESRARCPSARFSTSLRN